MTRMICWECDAQWSGENVPRACPVNGAHKTSVKPGFNRVSMSMWLDGLDKGHYGGLAGADVDPKGDYALGFRLAILQFKTALKLQADEVPAPQTEVMRVAISEFLDLEPNAYATPDTFCLLLAEHLHAAVSARPAQTDRTQE